MKDILISCLLFMFSGLIFILYFNIEMNSILDATMYLIGLTVAGFGGLIGATRSE